MNASGQGLLLALGGLPPETVVSERWIANQANKCLETIRRWRRCGMLPPTIKMGKEQVWTVRCLIAYTEERIKAAAAAQTEFHQRMQTVSVGGR